MRFLDFVGSLETEEDFAQWLHWVLKHKPKMF